MSGLYGGRPDPTDLVLRVLMFCIAALTIISIIYAYIK